ncbi:MAG: ABC transporter permease [Actinobacteria bacterium]|nr:ABC transporter permease [Actinomycetota bacterium]
MQNKIASSRKGLVKKFFNIQSIGTILVFVAIFVFFSIKSPMFLTFDNIINIIRQVSILIIIGMGMTILLIAGQVDLSVGAIVGMTGVISAMLVVNNHLPVYLSFIICILIGGVAGILNGIIVTKLNIPSLLATLGMMTAIRGFGFVVSKGATIFNPPPNFLWLGGGKLGPIPIPIIVMLIVFLIMLFIQERTTFAVHYYAIGGNSIAAHLSGINVQNYIIILFMISGLLAGLGGVISASRIGVGTGNLGTNLEFDVITAVVVGGTSIFGGIGNVQRTILGALIIGVVANGMIIINLNTFYQMIAKGLILIIAVGAETVRHKRAF